MFFVALQRSKRILFTVLLGYDKWGNGANGLRRSICYEPGSDARQCVMVDCGNALRFESTPFEA